MIFEVPTLQFVIAILVNMIGIALIGCGVNGCWTRFGRETSEACKAGRC